MYTKKDIFYDYINHKATKKNKIKLEDKYVMPFEDIVTNITN